MGLPAARHPSHWEEGRTSARRGNEIREWESCARARLVGPGLAARASRTAGPDKPAGGRDRTGQAVASRRTKTRRSVDSYDNRLEEKFLGRKHRGAIIT